jgi:acyl CoA:acetate/3-ketoacid CoA transferase beta subunit
MIGMATRVANHIAGGIEISLYSETGFLGMGPGTTDRRRGPRSDQLWGTAGGLLAGSARG